MIIKTKINDSNYIVGDLPFIYQDQIKYDYNGREYIIDEHDIKLDVPQGMIPEGKIAKVEIGVMMSGPFIFEESTQPISPILLFRCLTEVTEFEWKLLLPHCLDSLTMEKIHYHQIRFVKADLHVEGEEPCYKFTQCDTAAANFLRKDKCGILQTDSDGLFCITMLKSPDTTDIMNYCLAQVDLPPSPPVYEFDFYALLDLASHKRVRFISCGPDQFTSTYNIIMIIGI